MLDADPGNPHYSPDGCDASEAVWFQSYFNYKPGLSAHGIYNMVKIGVMIVIMAN